MMEENEERKEVIKELKYLFYTMPIKPPMECDDKDKWKDNNKKLRTALEYAITSLQEQEPILDKIKAEIKEWYWQADKQALAKDPCVVDAMIDLFIRTINKYKTESEDKE